MDKVDRVILKALIEEEVFLSTHEVAKIAEISWNTAIKHLEKLRKERYIDHIKRGNRDMWRLERVI